MLAARVLDDVDLGLEMLIQRMIGILLIEISAYHVFAWAEELLSDTDLVAGDGDAARLVSYIRQDEAPHVAYLATTLTEMRDRTFIGESGRAHSRDRGDRAAVGARAWRTHWGSVGSTISGSPSARWRIALESNRRAR